MDCIIVDDNKFAMTALADLISQVDFLNMKQECDNPISAFNYLKNNKIDLVFLDVEMPEMTGLELIKNLEERPIIILITGTKDYALEAFELNVADYLVKPVTLPRFMAAVSRAKELFENKGEQVEVPDKNLDFIFVHHKSAIIKIKIADILYIQALGDYVNIFTAENRYTVHITLGKIEKKLPADKFFRTHRSYIIALAQIDNIVEGTAYIKKHPIPKGEQFKQPLLKKINYI